MVVIDRFDCISITATVCNKMATASVDGEDSRSNPLQAAGGRITTSLSKVEKGVVEEGEEGTSVNVEPDLIEMTDFLNTKQSDLFIQWFDVKSDGKLVVLGYDIGRFTSQLWLYEQGTEKRLSQLDLPLAESADMLDRDKGQFIVAIYNESRLQMVNIDDCTLILGNSLDIGVAPRLILKYTDSSVILTATSMETDKHIFPIINMDGHIQEQITPGVDLDMPTIMMMSNDRNAIYISDNTKGCYGFNLKGDVIFHYTLDGCAYEYDGLAVGPTNTIYTCADKLLITLSPTGEFRSEAQVGKKHPLKYLAGKLYFVNNRDIWGEKVISFASLQKKSSTDKIPKFQNYNELD